MTIDAAPPLPELLRRRVRRLLYLSRQNQADLALALNLSQPDISKRLSGHVAFRVAELEALARFFGVQVPELFFDEYGRWDRRKAQRRVLADRRVFDAYALREEPQDWHPPSRLLTPPTRLSDGSDD